MLLLVSVLLSFMANCVPVAHAAQISLQFTRTTQSNNNRWKIPSFVKSGRIAQEQRPTSTTVSSLLLQVRGGSDNRGDPSGYYYDDNNNRDDYSSQQPQDKSPSKRPECEEKRVEDDYYYEQGPDGSEYYEEDRRYQEYDDRGRGGRSRRDDDRNPGAFASGLPSLIKYGDRKIGIGLLALGGFFTISGIFLFFHKTLLRFGNLLFIAGVPMTIGPGRTAGFFLQPKKARATAFLAFGIFLVFIGWPIFGMALEIFGLLNLFGNMIPMALVVLRQMPIVGGLFKMGSGGRRNDRRDDDRYYNDDDRYRDDRYNDDRYYGDDDNGGGGGGDRYY